VYKIEAALLNVSSKEFLYNEMNIEYYLAHFQEFW